MDIGTLVYFIFLIIIVIVNIYRKSAKKQKEQQEQRERQPQNAPQNRPEPEERTFEEVLQDIFGEKQAAPPQQPAPPQQSAPSKPQDYRDDRKTRTQEKSKIYKAKKKAEGEVYVNEFQQYMERKKSSQRSNISRELNQMEIIDLDQDDNLEIIDLKLEPDEMKKAVIYKTILERKYE